LSVIVLCNIGTGGVAGRIGQTVAKLYVPDLSLRTLEIQPDGDTQTATRLHQLIDKQLAGESNSVMLTKEARDSLATDSARANWQRIAAYGRLRKFDFVGRDIDGYGSGLFYRAEVGGHFLLLKFVPNGAGKISELSLEEEE
jgi:hypothetical protein